MMASELQARLAEPFPPADVGWKPQSVKGNRALAIAYIDARNVMDRLDEAAGFDAWQDEYETLACGSVVCRLRVKIGDEWVVKVDVGSPSEQPDGGDRLKAAFSDALKRAAVKYGIGRYLYNLPNVWADYDPTKKQFVNTPQLPAWALPKSKAAPTGTGSAKTAPKSSTAKTPADAEIDAAMATKEAFGEVVKRSGIKYATLVAMVCAEFGANYTVNDKMIDQHKRWLVGKCLDAIKAKKAPAGQIEPGADEPDGQ